jgi:E3 ubiquitin-protein ligase MYCBP2
VECGKTSSTKLEQHARKAALTMASAIIQNACDLMASAREKADEISSAEVLSNSYVVTTLLPLVLAHISPLATSDPRVCRGTTVVLV